MLAKEIGEKANQQALSYVQNCFKKKLEKEQNADKVFAEVFPSILILFFIIAVLSLGDPLFQDLQKLNDLLKPLEGVTVASGWLTVAIGVPLLLIKLPFSFPSQYQEICKEYLFILEQAQTIKSYFEENQSDNIIQ
jgi:hypothetical protein